LSKIEAGKIEIESAPFGLNKAVEEVIAFFQPRARGAGLLLAADIDPDVPVIVNADEARLRQIMTNLIGNAFKFTERGSIRIHVSCLRGAPVSLRETRRELRLFFRRRRHRDRHFPDKLPHLFKPFSQVDNSAERRRSGTGLGLIISRRLCEFMGGSISVDSTPGEGTTFRFSVLADYEVGDTSLPFIARSIQSQGA